MQPVSPSCGRLNSEDAKVLQPPFDRLCHFANEDGQLLPSAPRHAPPRSKSHDKRVASVFQVEFEPLGRKYGCTSCRLTVPSCEGRSGVLEQENAADLPIDVAGDPEPFLVAADEKRRDQLVDDARIKRPKLRSDRSAYPPTICRSVRRPARSQPSNVRAIAAAEDLCIWAALRSLRVFGWRRYARGLPRASVLGLGHGLSHLVADKRYPAFRGMRRERFLSVSAPALSDARY